MAEDKTKDEIEELEEDDEDEEDDPIVINLEFDNGEVQKTEIIGIFDVDGKTYIALEPDDDSGDVYIYGYDEEAGNKLSDIKDQEEFERAVKGFDKIITEAE